MSEWTDQRIELLKELWLEGVTSTEICVRLDISRSAVLGKIKRLGLNRKVLDAKEQRTPAKNTPEAVAAPAPVKATPVNSEAVPSHEPAPVAIPSRNRTPPPLDLLTRTFSAASSLTEVPDTAANGNGKGKTPKKYLSIWDLRDGCCKWPMGELLDRPEFFCGAATTPGSPWCDYHRSVAFPRDQMVKRAQTSSPPGFRGTTIPKIGSR